MAITDVNFPQAVAKIRQQHPEISPDNWRVTYNTHLQTGLTLENMNWQVVGLEKPTEQEMMDAQSLWDANEGVEFNNNIQLDANINNELSLNPINKSNVEVAYGLLNDLTLAFLNGNTPTTNVVYQGFVDRLVGTNLENPIKNYVTMMSGITIFNPTISDENKQTIMRITQLFLLSGLVVWIGKNM